MTVIHKLLPIRLTGDEVQPCSRSELHDRGWGSPAVSVALHRLHRPVGRYSHLDAAPRGARSKLLECIPHREGEEVWIVLDTGAVSSPGLECLGSDCVGNLSRCHPLTLTMWRV